MIDDISARIDGNTFQRFFERTRSRWNKAWQFRRVNRHVTTKKRDWKYAVRRMWVALMPVRLISTLGLPWKKVRRNVQQGAGLANETLFCRVQQSMACAHTFGRNIRVGTRTGYRSACTMTIVVHIRGFPNLPAELWSIDDSPGQRYCQRLAFNLSARDNRSVSSVFPFGSSPNPVSRDTFDFPPSSRRYIRHTEWIVSFGIS